MLVVEDDEAIVAFVVAILQEEGYQVDTATHGGDALAAVERRFPDVILLDVVMPEMDGLEFARRFHERYGAGCPIVVMAATKAKEHAAQIGAIAYLEKPFNLDVLLTIVAGCLPCDRASDVREGCDLHPSL